MKFKDFVDQDIKDFTELKLGLVEKEDTEIENLVRKVQRDFDLGSDVIKLKEELNKNLGKTYRGKYLFGFIKLERQMQIEKLKINKTRQKQLKTEYFEKSGELAKTQTELERKIMEKED